MNTKWRLRLPVAAFAIVVALGWVGAYLLGEWWWLALALVIGMVAGDLVQALLPESTEPKSKPKGQPRHRPPS